MTAKKPRLSPQDVAKLRDSQRELHDILELYGPAEECGIDCQAWRQLHQEAADRIEALLKNYGPSAG